MHEWAFSNQQACQNYAFYKVVMNYECQTLHVSAALQSARVHILDSIFCD